MLLFIDESGNDRIEAPYEVLAGVSVREHDLWNLILDIRKAEDNFFGLKMAKVGLEFKGRKLLKPKVFRFARQCNPIEPDKRRELTRGFLLKGQNEARGFLPEPRKSEEFAAYGQSVLSFVKEVAKLVQKYQVKVFAAMVSKSAPIPENPLYLRKDYAYLFERFYYYLEDLVPSENQMGLVVFDELEKAQSRILLNQLESYFMHTGKGTQRSERIVPEPFFVHSDLTTLVQLADIVGYCLNWGYRIGKKMIEKTRPEIEPYAKMFADLQYTGKRKDELNMAEWSRYGIFYIEDLRPKSEREIILEE